MGAGQAELVNKPQKKLELIISGGANKLQNYFQWKLLLEKRGVKVARAAAKYKKLTSIKVA